MITGGLWRAEGEGGGEPRMCSMDRQQEFVLRTIEERDIRFVRLWFTDVLGTLKSVAVAPAELEGAFAEGIGFDGSAIEGFARVYEADMLERPDPGCSANGLGMNDAKMPCSRATSLMTARKVMMLSAVDRASA